MLASGLGGIRQKVAAFWSERNRRERLLLSSALAAAALVLFYLWLIDPALSGRERLQKALPGLRQQSAELQALAREVKAIGGRAAGAAVQPLTQEALEASLARSGLKAQRAVASGDSATVELASVSFAATVDWLQQLQAASRWTVAEAKVTAQEKSDTVNASFTLRQQRGE